MLTTTHFPTTFISSPTSDAQAATTTTYAPTACGWPQRTSGMLPRICPGFTSGKSGQVEGTVRLVLQLSSTRVACALLIRTASRVKIPLGPCGGRQRAGMCAPVAGDLTPLAPSSGGIESSE